MQVFRQELLDSSSLETRTRAFSIEVTTLRIHVGARSTLDVWPISMSSGQRNPAS